MQGKKGLIMGVANDRSIAWGIAKKLSEHGAELAFTYVGDALKKRVIPLAESLGSKFTLDCNVEKKEEIVKTFSDIKDKWGHLEQCVYALPCTSRWQERNRRLCAWDRCLAAYWPRQYPGASESRIHEGHGQHPLPLVPSSEVDSKVILMGHEIVKLL